MFDDVKAYFVENILVLYKDYIKIKKSTKLGFSNDLRAAVNLSTALYHFREHIPVEKRKNKQEYINICEDYNLIEDVVNASKHGILTRNNPLISDARSIYEQVVFTTYEDKEGEFRHIEKAVIIKLNDGSERNLNEIIINVMNMWISELNVMEILISYPFIKNNEDKIPRRTKKSGTLNFESMQNLRFGARFKFQKFNYEKGIVEPVDLTGVDIEMKVYKPMYTGTLTAVKDGNELINIEIEIDGEELKQYNKLINEEDKINFFIKIAKSQGKIQ